MKVHLFCAKMVCVDFILVKYTVAAITIPDNIEFLHFISILTAKCRLSYTASYWTCRPTCAWLKIVTRLNKWMFPFSELILFKGEFAVMPTWGVAGSCCGRDRRLSSNKSLHFCKSHIAVVGLEMQHLVTIVTADKDWAVSHFPCSPAHVTSFLHTAAAGSPPLPNAHTWTEMSLCLLVFFLAFTHKSLQTIARSAQYFWVDRQQHTHLVPVR